MEGEPIRQIGIKMPARLSDRLEAIARRESNGISAVCRRLLEEALPREESRLGRRREGGDEAA